jgi:hypothetical protein
MRTAAKLIPTAVVRVVERGVEWLIDGM